MADIELVIKIPEELYEDIKEHGLCGYCSDREIVSGAIANGILLPKEHGDLIDRKELMKHLMDLANYPSNYVKIAQTVIEADKEGD